MIKGITLSTLGRKYEILKYVDPVSISYLERISEGFETGTMNLQAVKSDELFKLDLSRPIPNYSLIEIELMNGDIIQGYIVEDLVSQVRLSKNIFNHEMKFVEPIKLTTRVNMPGMTITQPKSRGFMAGGQGFASQLIVPDDKIFKGTAESSVKFNVDQNADTYNFLNSENKFYEWAGQKDTGLVFSDENPSEKKELMFENLAEIPENDKEKSLRLSLDIINPHYNIEIEQRKTTWLLKNQRFIRFRNAESRIKIVVKVGSQTVYDEIHTVPGGLVRSPYPLSQNASASWNEWANKSNSNIGSFYTRDIASPVSFNRSDGIGSTPNSLSPFAVDIDPGVLRFDKKINLPLNAKGEVNISVEKLNTQWNIGAVHESGKYKTWTQALNSVSWREVNRNKGLLITGGRLIAELSGDSSYAYKDISSQIEKVLKLNDRHLFMLDPGTKARLSGIKAPEMTYDKNNLYEILKDLGSYMGAIPKMRVGKIDRTQWIEATQEEYELGTNKLSFRSSSENFLNHLNQEHPNYPAGYVAMRTQSNITTDILEEIDEEEYDGADSNKQIFYYLHNAPQYSTDKDFVMAVIKSRNPELLEDLKDTIEFGYVIKVITRGGQTISFYKFVEESLNGDYAKSVVMEGMEVEGKEVYYVFHEDIDRKIVMEPENVQVKVISRNTEDYVSSIELNTDNLISDDEIVSTGWIGINGTTSNNFEKMTLDNIGLRLPNGPIYRIHKVSIMNAKEFKLGTGTTKIKKGDIFDITDLIMEEAYYNTLVNKSDYSISERLIETTKNQSLYYRQGDDMIYGLGFTGTLLPVHQQSTRLSYNRAIWEVIAKAAVKKYGEQTAGDVLSGKPQIIDPASLETDLDFRFLIEYVPYTSTRTNIYKDDQGGFQEQLTRYYNEQQKVNDAKALGRRAQSEINRMGNTEEELNGSTRVIENIPKVGTLDRQDGRMLTIINKSFLPNRIDYSGTYIKDYGAVNEYFGIGSAYRQYEIPKEDIVRRVDKRDIHAYVSKTRLPITALHGIMVSTLFEGLDTNGSNYYTPQYARVRTYDSLNRNPVDILKAVNTKQLGKGITHTFHMDDNYSAGKKIVRRTEDNQIQMFQQDIEYADEYGNFVSVDIEMLNLADIETNIGKMTDDGIFPLWNPEKSFSDYDMTRVSRYQYNVNKDSREAYSFSQDIRYFSNNPDIVIYDGIAEFSSMNSKDDVDIRLAVLRRPISKSSIIVKQSDIIENINNTFIVDNDKGIYNAIGSGIGVIVYEKNSMSPMLAIYGETSGEVYFGMDDFINPIVSPEYDHILDIRTSQRFEVDIDEIIGDSYKLVIESSQDVVYAGDGSDMSSYSLNIKSAQNIDILEAQGITESYLLDIISGQDVNVSDTSHHLESYLIDIISSQNIELNEISSGLVKYNLSIDTNQLIDIDGSSDYQRSYNVNIRTSDDLIVSQTSDYQRSYNVNIRSSENVNVSQISDYQRSYIINIKVKDTIQVSNN